MSDPNLLKNIGKICHKFPNARLADAFSSGQIDSKIWLADELKNLNLNVQKVWLLAGWYGVAAYILLKENIVDTVFQFDIDDEANNIADTLCQHYVRNAWQFKAINANVYELDYITWSFRGKKADGSYSKPLKEEPNLLINTSCEHLAYWNIFWNKIPQGKLVALQNNNFHDHPEHVNTKNSLKEWISELGLNEVYYSGTKKMHNYDRYMVIGKK